MKRATSILLMSLALAGCAGPSVRPIGADHPAHPDAAAAPLSPPSTTLALQNELATSDPPAPVARGGAASYACPMHPKVTSNAAGKCPECGMALKPVGGRPAPQPAGQPAAQPATPPAGQNQSGHDHGAHNYGTPDHGAHNHGGHQ